MATKFDFENFNDEIQIILRADLNTKITAIDAEKVAAGGVAVMKSVDTLAYYFQSMNIENVNFNPFIFTGIADIDTITVQANTAQNFSYDIFLVFLDDMNDDNVGLRIFRYQRAIREVIEENYSKISNTSNIEVSDLNPIPLVLGGGDQGHKATGIQLRAAIA